MISGINFEEYIYVTPSRRTSHLVVEPLPFYPLIVAVVDLIEQVSKLILYHYSRKAQLSTENCVFSRSPCDCRHYRWLVRLRAYLEK